MALVIWPTVPEHEVAAIREAAGAMEVLAPQSEAEAREELSTLFNDPATVQSWLDRMPLKAVQTQ